MKAMNFSGMEQFEETCSGCDKPVKSGTWLELDQRFNTYALPGTVKTGVKGVSQGCFAFHYKCADKALLKHYRIHWFEDQLQVFRHRMIKSVTKVLKG